MCFAGKGLQYAYHGEVTKVTDVQRLAQRIALAKNALCGFVR